MYREYKYIKITMIGFEETCQYSIYASPHVKLIKKEYIFINRESYNIIKSLYLHELINKFTIVNGIRNRLRQNNENNLRYKLCDIINEMKIEFNELKEKDQTSLAIFDNSLTAESINGINIDKWVDMFDQLMINYPRLLIKYREETIDTIDLKAIEDQYDIDLSEE